MQLCHDSHDLSRVSTHICSKRLFQLLLRRVFLSCKHFKHKIMAISFHAQYNGIAQNRYQVMIRKYISTYPWVILPNEPPCEIAHGESRLAAAHWSHQGQVNALLRTKKERRVVIRREPINSHRQLPLSWKLAKPEENQGTLPGRMLLLLLV